jgi:hypothetical protein
MIKNMSNIDRGIRIVVAAVIAVLYFSGIVTGTLGIVLLVLAGVFLITSGISFCPLYVPLKISTRKS